MSSEKSKAPAPYGPISWTGDEDRESEVAVTDAPAPAAAKGLVAAEVAPAPAPETAPELAPALAPAAASTAPEPESPRRAAPAIAAAIVISLLIGGAAGGAAGWIAARTTSDPGSTNTVTEIVRQISGDASAAVAPAANNIGQVADVILPSLVGVEWGEAESPNGGGSGSGVIIRSDGHILTNAHVVVGAASNDDLRVVLQDGTKLQAKLLGRNNSYDLAVLKVEQPGLQAAEIGDSAALRVGDPVIAFGSPLGLSGTVTSGIVSALERPVTVGDGEATSFVSAIQTDAAINPGNSGGPLVDAAARVIGINSSIATLGFGAAGNIGLGFAIPIKYAMRIANEIISTGKSEIPVIGVVPDNRYEGDGARVGEITAGGPAEGIGLQVGDVIETVNDRKINGVVELVVRIRENAPGDTVKLGVKSEGRQLRDVYITLEGRTEE
jgi:putative serine protease PepD